MADAPRTGVATGGTRHVRISTRTAVLAVGTLVAVLAVRNAFTAANRVLGWAAACAAIAVLLTPLVSFLGRYVPRVLAVLGTFAVAGAVVGGLIFGVVDDLDREVGRLQRAAPEATATLEARDDELGSIARDLRLADRVDAFLDELDRRVGSGSGTLAQNAPTLPTYVVNAVLTIFLLIYGPGIVGAGIDRIDDRDRRAAVRDALDRATERARRTVAALLAQGVVVGSLTWLGATTLDLPAPIALGVVGGVAGMVPDFGIVLGALPMAGLTAGLEDVRTGLLVLGVAVITQLAEAIWVRHRVDALGVAVGPAVVIIVALLGYSIYGIGMAVYGVIYATFVAALIDQVPDLRRRVGEAAAA